MLGTLVYNIWLTDFILLTGENGVLSLKFNKSLGLAAAEMGNRARAKWTEKLEGYCAAFHWGAGSPSNTMPPGPY